MQWVPLNEITDNVINQVIYSGPAVLDLLPELTQFNRKGSLDNCYHPVIAIRNSLAQSNHI
jgi:hypothetical protein